MSPIPTQPVDSQRTTERPQLLAGDEALQKIRALLEDFRTAMLTTADAGIIRTRPMGVLGKAADFDGTLWFFTDERSHVMQEVERGVRSTLIFQSDAKNAYLQLEGRASALRDRARMAELHTPLLKAWFPDGLDDPHLSLIRFESESGHFWDSPGGIFQVLGAFAKAIVTHQPGQGGHKGDLELH
jgi:general stress protein 26